MRLKAGVVILLALAAGLVCPAISFPSSTSRWEIDSFKAWSQGEGVGVEINSAGEIRPVWAVESLSLPAEGIWSMAAFPLGPVYLGTGNSGKLFRYEGGRIEEVAAVNHVAVTCVRVDRRGRVWFAAIPKGTIYRLSLSGVEKVAEVGEEYIWDFLITPREIIAATGPRGKIFRLSHGGAVLQTIETGEKHVMTLAESPGGEIYAGTAGEGLVLQLTSSGYEIKYDFAETEVRRLLWIGKGKQGQLIAAVNEAAGARPPESRPSASWKREGEEEEGGGEEKGGGEKEKGPPLPTAPEPPPRGPGKVSGAVYLLTSTGGARKLVALDKRAAVDLAAAGQDIYVATDQEGKIYRCRPDGADYALSFDLKEAQALSLLADDNSLTLIGAGSPGALVNVKRHFGEKGVYTSAVFDAKFPARWGNVEWEADGPVMVFTRSGNVSEPDRGWSAWEPVGVGKPHAVKSPASRYLQLKIEWLPGSRATVRFLSLSYRVFNQAHYVDRVVIEPPYPDSGEGERGGSSRGRNPEAGPLPHKTERKIAWEITNPDDDSLEFSLFFQPENSSQWLPIKTPEPLTKTRFTWDTAYVPDGWYRLKVIARDSPVNPAEEVFIAEAVSERFLIDNLPPEIKGLTVFGGMVSGRVEDKLSAVAGIQFQIDAGEWVTVSSVDGILDSPVEHFRFSLPASLEPGPHIITLRAWDRAQNVAAAKEQFTRK